MSDSRSGHEILLEVPVEIEVKVEKIV